MPEVKSPKTILRFGLIGERFGNLTGGFVTGRRDEVLQPTTTPPDESQRF